MVMLARRLGASAHYAGSGGSILGIYEDGAMLDRLRREFEPLGCRVILPRVTGDSAPASSG
jgi:glucuronokinase